MATENTGRSQEEFSLTAQAIDEMQRRYLTRGIPFAAVLVAIGVGFGFQANTPAWAYLIPVLFVFGFGFFSLRKAIAKQLAIQRSFRLVLDDSAITRFQTGLDPFAIAIEDIESIQEFPGRCLVIRGRGFQRFISAPAGLGNFQSLRSRLSAVRPITVATPSRARGYLALAGILAAAVVFMVVLRSTTKSLVFGLGIPVLGVYVALALWMFMTPISGPEARKVRWLTLLPIGLLALKFLSLR